MQMVASPSTPKVETHCTPPTNQKKNNVRDKVLEWMSMDLNQ